MVSRKLMAGVLTFVLSAPLTASATELEPEWREPVERLAAFVADLSAGEMEAAWQKYRIMLPEPPASPKSPFDPDPFEHFTNGIGRFPPDVESLALIAERRYTAKSRRLYFMADSKVGPVLIETMVYQHKDEWYFTHFGFQALSFVDMNWHKAHEDILPLTRLSKPVSVPLPKPSAPVEAAAP